MTQGLLAPLGFRFSATSAKLRKDGRVDLGLAVADAPATVAALYTKNVVKAAPVLISAARTQDGFAQAILANCGCANACTGEEGVVAARSTTRSVAEALGIDEALVLPASTGVIGTPLPKDKILAAVPELVTRLSAEAHEDFAQAICTTDRWKKVAGCALGSRSRLLGIAKGAGMIHPELGYFAPEPSTGLHATMLAFLFTDAVVSQEILKRALEAAVEESFNAASVDGDTSTNDTVVVMASGKSGEEVGQAELTRALTVVCTELAESMVRDGEGSEHLAELLVSGLGSDAEARQVAKTVATSLLVKTAMAGKDPNWGRWLGAAGRAGVVFEPSQVELRIEGITLVRGGMGVPGLDEAKVKVAMMQPRYRVELVLGQGPGHARYFMTDLGHAYVNVNADYRS